MADECKHKQELANQRSAFAQYKQWCLSCDRNTAVVDKYCRKLQRSDRLFRVFQHFSLLEVVLSYIGLMVVCSTVHGSCLRCYKIVVQSSCEGVTIILATV